MDFVVVKKGIFALGLSLAVNIVHALPITGVLEFAGVFTPVQQANDAITGFSKVKVSYAQGDFANWLVFGQNTSMAGVDLSTYPAAWSVGGLSINLLSGVEVDQNDLPIDLAGLGFVNFQNYDQTNINWSFSETTLTSSKSLFTLRIETVKGDDPVEVPEPSSAVLLGIGALVCGILRRRIK